MKNNNNNKKPHFCTSKCTAKKVKRQPTKEEKIFVSHIFDKGLVSRVYKDVLQLNNRQIKKWAMEIDISPNGEIDTSPKKMYKWLVNS